MTDARPSGEAHDAADSLTRRRLLRATGAGAVGLAALLSFTACGGGDGGGEGDGENETEEETTDEQEEED